MSRLVLIATTLVLAASTTALAGAGGVTGPAFYVDGTLYRTVGTPTDLNPHRRAPGEGVDRVVALPLTNALGHTPSDGSVAVVVESDGDAVRVRVEDTGEGLAGDAAVRMFERFWRGDRARSGDGAGLGLAIARGLVEAHGGRIWAEPRSGGGASVSFTLPAG